MVNRELGLQIVAIAENEPDRYDQGLWTNLSSTDIKVKETTNTVINCGTKACLAGHASFIAAPAGTKFYYNQLRLPDGSFHSYDHYGAKALGLPLHHCDLFSASTPLQAIRDYFNATTTSQREKVMGALVNDEYEPDEDS